jgi:CRISPR system Cascade subunit CasC
MVLGQPEIEWFLKLTRTIVDSVERDPSKVKDATVKVLKQESRNLHNLRLGAGIDAAMFGRFVSGDRDARVDAAVHVAHAFSVHEQASEPDYFTAVDDLQAEEQGAGAGHLNTADLTSGVYYGYVVGDMPLLVSNLEGCDRKKWEGADRALAARTVEHLLHLIAKVTPGAKKGSTAPYDWASLLLVEAGDEQPRTLANAFLKPVHNTPLDQEAAAILMRHVKSIDDMYGASAKRWLATRHEGIAAPDTAAVSFPDLVRHIGATIRGDA